MKTDDYIYEWSFPVFSFFSSWVFQRNLIASHTLLYVTIYYTIYFILRRNVSPQTMEFVLCLVIHFTVVLTWPRSDSSVNCPSPWSDLQKKLMYHCVNVTNLCYSAHISITGYHFRSRRAINTSQFDRLFAINLRAFGHTLLPCLCSLRSREIQGRQNNLIM